MIKIAMCDDDIATIKVISAMFEAEIMQQDFDAEIIMVTDNQKNIFDAIYNHDIDILFLDVDFKTNGKNGIEFANDLRKINKDFYLIFLTGHERYMKISLLVKVYDYLIKPINRDVLSELIIRLKNEFENEKRVFLHLNKWVSIKINEILYIEKFGNKCRVITNIGDEMTSKTLDNLLNELPASFCKCHKSYIVNESKIVYINKKTNYVYFSKDIKCPINMHYNMQKEGIINE
ncbi:MAG: LytTR family DNA-binding domain-containing protein [Clostridia bacterium]